MTCALCDGQRFCLCQRLLAPPKPKPGNAPIDHALDDVQRLMDETRIRKEALRMANALVKLLEGSK